MLTDNRLEKNKTYNKGNNDKKATLKCYHGYTIKKNPLNHYTYMG